MVEYSPAKEQVEIVTIVPEVLIVAVPKEVLLVQPTGTFVSVAELLAGLGSTKPPIGIVAVLTRLPVAVGEIVAIKVKVAALPAGKSI